ncbi:MAG: methyltransferase domain-containing protein [Nocardioidaceae bacterium]
MAAEQQTGHNTMQRRSAARTAVVWDALRDVLGDASGTPGTAGATPVHVLDIGGGTGGFAVLVAGLGHRVTVVDPSPDALAILARRAEESGVADRVSALQGDIASLSSLLPDDGAVDAVLCHGVLEIVDDPAAALAGIGRVLRPGGTLSLLVNQRHAAVVTRAMAGHFVSARALLDDPTAGGTGRRFTADEVTALLDDTGFDPRAMHAVRVFVDLVPSSLVDLEPGAAGALVELERAVSARPEYLPLATQLHVLATRR